MIWVTTSRNVSTSPESLLVGKSGVSLSEGFDSCKTTADTARACGLWLARAIFHFFQHLAVVFLAGMQLHISPSSYALFRCTYLRLQKVVFVFPNHADGKLRNAGTTSGGRHQRCIVNCRRLESSEFCAFGAVQEKARIFLEGLISLPSQAKHQTSAFTFLAVNLVVKATGSTWGEGTPGQTLGIKIRT